MLRKEDSGNQGKRAERRRFGKSAFFLKALSQHHDKLHYIM